MNLLLAFFTINILNEKEYDYAVSGEKIKLKKEIVSLNEEIKSLLKRIKNTEEGDYKI